MKNRLFILILVCLVMLAGCGEEKSSGDIIKELNELLKAEFFLPDVENFVINHAYASRLPEEFNPSGEHFMATVKYSVERGDKVKDYDHKDSTIVYGPYLGPMPAFVIYLYRGPADSSYDLPTKEIDGYLIHYDKTDAEDLLMVFFDIDSQPYTIEFYLDNISEDEAWAIVENLVRKATN